MDRPTPQRMAPIIAVTVAVLALVLVVSGALTLHAQSSRIDTIEQTVIRIERKAKVVDRRERARETPGRDVQPRRPTAGGPDRTQSDPKRSSENVPPGDVPPAVPGPEPPTPEPEQGPPPVPVPELPELPELPEVPKDKLPKVPKLPDAPTPTLPDAPTPTLPDLPVPDLPDLPLKDKADGLLD